VTGETLADAIYRAEDCIDAILVGRVRCETGDDA
jgi:hypothetical protein